MFIIATIIYTVVIVSLPETCAPRLLDGKTADISTRYKPRSIRYKPRSIRFTQSLLQPWIVLFTEPILFLFSLYMAFVYSVLFLDFIAYPVVFQSTRGWSAGISGLSFSGIGLGVALAIALSPLVNRLHGHYVQKLGPVPEACLPHLVIIVWLLPISLFWFGWTALPSCWIGHAPWRLQQQQRICLGAALMLHPGQLKKCLISKQLAAACAIDGSHAGNGELSWTRMHVMQYSYTGHGFD